MTDVLPLRPSAVSLPEPPTQLATKPVSVELAALLVDAKGVARMTGRSVRTVRRLDAAEELPAPVRLGGSVCWRVADVELWVELGCPDRATFESVKRRRR